MGSLDEMSVFLGDFSGRIIEEFKDVEEQTCSFKRYIISHGLCTSKNNIFLMTSDKTQEEAWSTQTENDVVLKSQGCTPKQLHIAEDNVQSCSNLNIKYLLETESSYSEVCTRLSCNSLQDCRNVAFSLEAHYDDYNPLLDGFKVLSISKDGEQLLGCKYEDDGTINFIFPCGMPNNDNIIIYGPDKVNGKESSNGNIILGVVASCHGKGCEYTWFRDGAEYLSGDGLAVLEIQMPGTYTVGVKFDSVIYIHDQAVTIRHDEITPDKPVTSGTPRPSGTRRLSITPGVSGTPRKLGTSVTSGMPETSDTSGTPWTSVTPTCKTSDTSGTSDTPWTSGTPGTSGTSVTSVTSGTSGTPWTSAIPWTSSTSKTPDIHVPGTSDTPGNHNVDVSIPFIDKKDVSYQDAIEIGQGSFGKVFRADWLGTPVAIKEIRVKRMKLLRNVLHGEVQLQGRVRHPNIVLLMAYAIDKSYVYILSEYVNGPNLDEILFGCSEDSNGQVFVCTRADKLSIAQDILKAVAYLHNLSPPVIHTDIKPENIVLHRQSMIAKLCDFGVSRVKKIESQTCTGINVQPGTPMYQAPEVLIRYKKSSKASDIWSLSCTLVELFTEVSIWNVEDIEQVIDKMKRLEVPSAYQQILKDDSHASVSDLVGSGLKYEPDNRPMAMNLLSRIKSLQ